MREGRDPELPVGRGILGPDLTVEERSPAAYGFQGQEPDRGVGPKTGGCGGALSM